MDKVAVILPVYKKDKISYVRLSIDSILNQTYKGSVTLYVGVDGPIDKNLMCCLQEYEANGVKVQWYDTNRGLAIVLNNLLDIAHKDGFEYIARMDADDISISDRLEKQMTFMIEHPEIDVVGGSIEEIDEDGNSRDKTIIYPNTHQDCYNFFAKRNPHAHPAVLFRWRYFEKARCKYRPEYRQNQDTMLWVDGMSRGTRHANIPDIVLRFRFTDALFKKRRNGWAFAKKQLQDRKYINKTLGYGFTATVFGYMMFMMIVSPAWIKKIAYKVFR